MSYNFRLDDALRKIGHDPKKHLPEAGIMPRRIDLTRPDLPDVSVWVMAKAGAVFRGITQRPRAVCPHCNKEFALGNLHQHMFGNRKSNGKRQRGCVEIQGGK